MHEWFNLMMNTMGNVTNLSLINTPKCQSGSDYHEVPDDLQEYPNVLSEPKKGGKVHLLTQLVKHQMRIGTQGTELCLRLSPD